MRALITGCALLALAGCAGQAATVSTDTAVAQSATATTLTDAAAALSVLESAITAYKATPNPSQPVIAEATKLDTEALAAINRYGPEASTAIAAISALSLYLLTSAPGNGTTPSTVPLATAS